MDTSRRYEARPGGKGARWLPGAEIRPDGSLAVGSNELTNVNLLELKKFKPNEQVLVELSPVQVSLFDQEKTEIDIMRDDNEGEYFITFIEDEPKNFCNKKVIKEFKIS